MPTWLKVTLGVLGGGFVVLALLVVGVVWYVRAHKDELLAVGKEAMESGQQFGQDSNSQGCIDEGLRRLRSMNALTDEIKNNLFVTGCLGAAAPAPGFCADVPEEGEIMKTVAWRMSKCAAHAELDAQKCQRFMAVWQKACHSKTPGELGPAQ